MREIVDAGYIWIVSAVGDDEDGHEMVIKSKAFDNEEDAKRYLTDHDDLTELGGYDVTFLLQKKLVPFEEIESNITSYTYNHVEEDEEYEDPIDFEVLDVDESLFVTGRIVITSGINSLIEQNINFQDFVLDSLSRHMTGDWGNLSEQDRKTNDESVKQGNRMLSAYISSDSNFKKIWIITEGDRSVTTVLLPEEY